MKKSKLIGKVNRYLLLSKEFEQDVDILFEDRAVEASSMTLTTSSGNLSYIGSTESNFQNVVIEAKTRAEVILEKAQSEANRSDRYDEYKKLQETLSKYFRFYIVDLKEI